MNQLIIGIAGPSAGGKTTVTSNIISQFTETDYCVISVDDYYKDQTHLSKEERRKVNYDHPNAFDLDLLFEHLKLLLQGKNIEVPIYDFVEDNRTTDVRIVKPTKILIVEGLYALYDPRIYNLFTIKIYVETDSDLCFIRRLQRDVEERGRTIDSVITQYTTSVRPMYREFIKPTRENADLIIPNGGENKVAIDIVQKSIIEHLQGGNNE